MRVKQSDEIDKFISQSTDKNWWRKLKDELNNKDMILTD